MILRCTMCERGEPHNPWGGYAIEADVSSLREYSMEKFEDLRKDQEEKNKVVNKINEKMMMQDDQIESMKNQLEEMKERQNEIIAANSEGQCMMPTSTTIRILNNIVAKIAVEKEANNLNSKIAITRQFVSRIEDQRKHSVDWLVEKYKKKEFMAVIARAVPDKAEDPQKGFKSMTEDCRILDNLFNEAITIVSNAAFDRDITEKAKNALNSGLVNVKDLYDEIAHQIVVMADSPRSVSLDGIKGCLKNVERAINSVPSMVTQTTIEYINEEMKKLEIKIQ